MPASVGDAGDMGPLEKAMAIHSSILPWKIPWTEEPGGYSPWGHKELDMTEQLSMHACTVCTTLYLYIFKKY